MESGGKYSQNRSHFHYIITVLHINFQVIESVASGSLNFLSGLLVATLSTWPQAAVPAGILFGNTILLSIILSATASATGAHINPMVTMATAFSGLCHPVRAAIYLICQLAGGAIGGALLRVALGKKLAYEIHNAGCWVEPGGEVDVWQAASIEFTASFILLSVVFLLSITARATRSFSYHFFYPRFLAYGVGLDPRQAKVYGPKYGPVLVGLLVGILSVQVYPISCLPIHMGVWARFPSNHADGSTLKLAVAGLHSRQPSTRDILGRGYFPDAASDWPLESVNSNHHIGSVGLTSFIVRSRDTDAFRCGLGVVDTRHPRSRASLALVYSDPAVCKAKFRARPWREEVVSR